MNCGRVEQGEVLCRQLAGRPPRRSSQRRTPDNEWGRLRPAAGLFADPDIGDLGDADSVVAKY